MSFAVVGEALVDLIVGADGAYHPYLGGSPFNVAIGLARQGAPVSYLSPLSDDHFGNLLLRSLISEGVSVPLSRRSLLPTSLALVTLSADRIPSYRLYRQGIADKDISCAEIIEQLPQDLRVFHTGSLAITPSQLATMRELFEVMHQRGVLVSLDINIRLGASAHPSEYLDGVWSLLNAADIVKVSDEDLAPFKLARSPRQSAEIAFEQLRGGGLLVLTEGSKGATLFSGQGSISRPAHRVPALGDTVGAGDTFYSAFLASLYIDGAIGQSAADSNLDVLEKALDYAGAAAAINVSRKGCSPPTRREMIEVITELSD